MSGIKRWDWVNQMVRGDDGGRFVKYADHEAEVARLRAEVSALKDDPSYETACETIRKLRAEVEENRVDAERWDWIMSNYYGGDLARTQRIIGQCWTREQMEEAIDKDLSERKQAAMGASA